MFVQLVSSSTNLRSKDSLLEFHLVRRISRLLQTTMAPNFTVCGIEFKRLFDAGNKSLAYNGTISGVLSQGDRPALIIIKGCLDLCGHGHQLYTS
jgi:hypothetical protein